MIGIFKGFLGFGILILLMLKPGSAEIVVARENLRGQTVLTSADVFLAPGEHGGAASRLGEVLGKELKSSVFSGRPILLNQVGVPAVINRNELITILYKEGDLMISTVGRALDRAALGEILRVLNEASRKSVSGVVVSTGVVQVFSSRGG